MDIQDLLAAEMENISRSDEALLAGMSCTLGGCGIDNGFGACGESHVN